MGYSCMIKLINDDGKEIGRFPAILYRSYKQGERTWGIVDTDCSYEVVEEVTLTLKQIGEKNTICCGQGE